MSIKHILEANFIELAKNLEERGLDREGLHRASVLARIMSSIFWLGLLAIFMAISPIAGIILSPLVILALYSAFTGAAAISRYADL